MSIKPYNAFEDEALDNAGNTIARRGVNKFLSEYVAQTAVDPNPQNSESRVWPHDTQDVRLEVLRYPNRVHLGYIASLRPEKPGAGSMALKWLCNLADKYKVVIELVVANPTGKTAKLSKAELTNWYKRNGFEEDKRSGDGTMIRVPQKGRGWPT